MACFKHCRKWTVLLFNLIFLIVGLVLLILGTVWKIQYKNLDSVIPTSYAFFAATPIIFIVLGVIIVTISALGSLGVFKKNSYLLSAHTIILLVFFVVQIILSIVSFWVLSQDALKENINANIKDIYNKNNTEIIDFIQKELHCCGPDGPKSATVVIKSCFQDEDISKMVYSEGCKKATYNFILATVRGIGTTLLVLATFEVIGATLSLSLANAIRNYNRRYGRYE